MLCSRSGPKPQGGLRRLFSEGFGIQKGTSAPGPFRPVRWAKLRPTDIPPALRHHFPKVPVSLPPVSSRDLEGYVRVADLQEMESLGQSDTNTLARLAHNLDRVLFSLGVHHQRDARTGVYNFTPYLSAIPSFATASGAHYNQYTPPSTDQTLRALAVGRAANAGRYYALTSSLTGCLAQLHYLLSGFRPPSTVNMAKNVAVLKQASFSPSAMAPASIVVSREPGLSGPFAIDADKSMDVPLFLSEFGICMEKVLTHTPSQFRALFGEPGIPEVPPNAYQYSGFQKFVLRSQLDCYDPRLPGTGTFDLKTRSVCAIRFDQNHSEAAYRGVGGSISYLIHQTHGLLESFEREYYDLIRTGMLKYGLQARIGMMDGIFICYHNTELALGYQYVPLEALDHAFHSHAGSPEVESALEALYLASNSAAEADAHGSRASAIAGAEFRLSLHLWERILDRVTSDHPSAVRVVMKALATHVGRMQIVVCPLTPAELHTLQHRAPEVTLSTPHLARMAAFDAFLHDTAALNKKTLTKAELWELDVAHFFGLGKPCLLDHPSPRNQREVEAWEVSYTLRKSTQSPKRIARVYLDLLSEREFWELPVEGSPPLEFVERLRRFSRFGKERREAQLGTPTRIWLPQHPNDLQ